MGQKIGQLAVRRIFFEHPTKEFHIREIARMLHLSKTTVAHHIKNLLKENIILSKKRTFKVYFANETSRKYKLYKLLDALERIGTSGLIERLEAFYPRSIVLFGSFAKAEYDEKSDIDLFVECAEQQINLRPFEKKLNHKIHLFFAENIHDLSPQLFNNIINGIKLSGFIKGK